MGKELTLERSSKDYHGRQNITIKIDDVDFVLPLQILKDFANDDNVIKTYVPIPD